MANYRQQYTVEEQILVVQEWSAGLSEVTSPSLAFLETDLNRQFST